MIIQNIKFANSSYLPVIFGFNIMVVPQMLPLCTIQIHYVWQIRL